MRHSPLMPARSLGRLLGFESLAFKLETGQPTGSWLDRDAIVFVERAAHAGCVGVCLVGAGPLGPPLTVQCARAGLRFVTLCTPGDRRDVDRMVALGARHVVVDGEPAELTRVARTAAASAGLLLVEVNAESSGAGLAAVTSEIAAAGYGASLVAVPALTGFEPWALPVSPLAVLGYLDTPPPSPSHALAMPVTVREAEAARRLLAHEEGMITSLIGAAGFAALVRAAREDRARRQRDRRLAARPSAVVVVTGDAAAGLNRPPVVSENSVASAISLAMLEAEPGRWLLTS